MVEIVYKELDKNETMEFICRELQIEPTNRCNLECSICSHTFSDNLIERDLAYPEFKLIINKFPNLERVLLQGVGEPFLNPDLLDMVSYAIENNLYVYTTSNAILFNENLIEEMISSGLQELRISLDTVNKDSYTKIKLGGELDNVIENIELINRMKEQFNVLHPLLKINVVAMKDTIFQLPQLIEIAHKLNIVEVSLIPLVIHGQGRAVEEQNISSLPKKTLLSVIQEAKALGEKLKVDVVSGVSVEKLPDFIEIERSSTPKCYNSMYIQSNGDISPCCNITIRFGNVLQEELCNILKNERLKRLKNFIEIEHPTCHECTRYVYK